MAAFTPTEQRFLNLLADGLPHARRELFALLGDSELDLANVAVHISNIRRKLPTGQTILCEIVSRRICYRHVALLGSATW